MIGSVDCFYIKAQINKENHIGICFVFFAPISKIGLKEVTTIIQSIYTAYK